MRTAVIHRIEKRVAVRIYHQFGTAFGSTVRIITAHGIGFNITAILFTVFITFIAGNDHHAPDRPALSARFKQIDRPHDVGFKGFHRNLIRVTDDGLGRQMKDYFRLEILHDLQNSIPVADIANFRTHWNIEQIPVIKFPIRFQRDTANFRAEMPQKCRQI